MNDIKLAFFDLDGTFLDSKTHAVPASNIEAIEKLQAKGIKCFVASGRSYALLSTMEGVLDVKWDGYICNNGNCIHDKNGSLTHFALINNELVKEMIAFCEKEHMTINLHTDDDRCMAPLGIDKYMIEAHTFFAEPLPSIIKPYQDEKIMMALIYNEMTYDFHKIEKIKGLKALPNQSTYADVVLKDTSKAKGIEFILEDYQLTKDHCIAFGDADNDLEMLEYVTYSVAMGNGTDNVKKIASYITDSVENQGILKALKHFNLL